MKSKTSLGLLTVTHGINDMYQGAIPAMLPFLVVERGYSYALITGITLAATGLSSVLQPLFGMLTDRRPMAYLVTVGMLVSGIGVGVSGLTHDYVLTWLAIAFSGIGGALFHPAGAKAARAAGGGSARSMSVFAAGGSVGVTVAPIFVAVVLGTTGTVGTWVLAIPALVVGVVAAVAQSRGTAAITAASRTRASTETSTRDNWRGFAVLAGVAVFWSIPFVVMSTFAALNVIARFGVSTAVGAATLTAFTVGGIGGTLAGGWGSQRWGRIPVIRAGYVIALLAVIGVVVLPSLPAVLVCTVVLGTALFVPFAAQITLGQDYLPNRVGTASGLTLGLTASVGGLLSPVFGILADKWGVQAVLAALIGVLSMSVLLAWCLPEPGQPAQPETQKERDSHDAVVRTG